MMKKLLSKRLLSLITVISILLAIGAVAYADAAIKSIKATLNANIAIEVDGTEIDLKDGNKMLAPIIYEGRSYVPAKYLANALGAEVNWDGKEQKIVVTSKDNSNSSTPYKDVENSSPTTTPPTTAPSTTAPSDNASVVKFYPNDTTAEKMYEDNKDAAAALIELYANALKTGNTSAINTWLKSNIQKNEFGDAYEISRESVQESVDAYRDRYESDILDPLADSAISAMKSNNFNSDSEYKEYTNSKDLRYAVDVSGAGYEGYISVYFFYTFDRESNKYFFSQVAM